jgi:NAD(P)-dependent dehydrogenase (short-subunit alcohol dehydrogenase family)
MTKTILITGVSSGLGRAFAGAALDAGYRVLGSVRTPQAAEAFEAQSPTRAQALVLDITDSAQVAERVGDAVERLGPLDALVNNAGYGHEGILEESSLSELRNQFEANVFGAVAMIQAVLPGMRRRRSGRIINVTSMGGFITMPAISFYCGSKFALEGISESLGKEVAPFGIRVTALAPGQFRTDWAGRSMQRASRSIAEYDPIMNPLREARMAKSGRQPGNPAKAAQALLKVLESDDPPTRLFLGGDALHLVANKLEQMKTEMKAWESVSRSTDFEVDAPPSR